MIEYTMYVSSRDGGTRPFRTIKAKEFHEIQWNQDLGHKGRLVGQKSIDLHDASEDTEADNMSTLKHSPSTTRPQSKNLTRHNDLRALIKRFSPRKKASSGKTAWLAGVSGMSTAASLRDLLDSKPSPLVNEWEIPNAIFARKFDLFTDAHSLPTSIKELPVAEDKAMDLAVGSPVRGLVYSWRFQGPFTPQLWFDSGLDYRWRRK